MKNSLILFVMLQFFCSEVNAQKLSNSKVLGKWQFAQITLVSPKQGYIPSFETQETNLMRLSMANYTFNEDGSVVLAEEYTKKTGIVKATWKLNADQTGLDITYYFSEESAKNPETLPWKVENVTATDLSLKLQKIFVVKFKKTGK